MTQVNVLEARNNLSQLIIRASAGEEIVIAKRDIPLVRLVPVRSDLPHGTGRAVAAWLADHPVPPRLVRTGSQIDADVHAAREAWS